MILFLLDNSPFVKETHWIISFVKPEFEFLAETMDVVAPSPMLIILINNQMDHVL